MVKKKSHPKLSQKKIIAIVLTALIIASISYLAIVQRSMQSQINELSTIKIGSLILEAVDNLNKPLPIDPQTGDHYIPESKLRLPANGFPANRLEYSHTAKSEDFPEELRLSSVSAVNQSKVAIVNAPNIDKLFEVVPKLQACARGFRLTFERAVQSEEGLSFIFEKTLSDGRQLYVESEDSCAAPDYFDMEFLKQIDSY